MSVLDRIQRKKEAARTISRVISENGYSLVIDHNDIHVCDSFVTELTTVFSISNLIFEALYPTAHKPDELHHYTSFPAFKAIIASGHIRLSSIRTRLGGEGELVTFAEDHGLGGYLDTIDRKEALFREFSDDLFFLSTNRPGIGSEEDLWEGFGKKGKGVRLSLAVSPRSDAQLRELRYRKGLTLLGSINAALTDAGFPMFIPHGLSRMIAFYLPEEYRTEGEVRLLIKRFENFGGPWIKQGNHSFYDFPLNAVGPYGRIDLVGVTPGSAVIKSDVEQVLSGSVFSATPCT